MHSQILTICSCSSNAVITVRFLYLYFAGLQIQYEKQKTIVYSYSSLNENLKEDLEWHDICMVSKKDAHILCVHLNCPMVPMQLSTKAVLLIGINPSEESALDLAVNNYGDVPIVVVNDSGQQLWHALCQEERISGKIFAQSQMKTAKTDQGISLIDVGIWGYTYCCKICPGLPRTVRPRIHMYLYIIYICVYSGTPHNTLNEDTSINRTLFGVPNAMFVYNLIPEIRTRH